MLPKSWPYIPGRLWKTESWVKEAKMMPVKLWLQQLDRYILPLDFFFIPPAYASIDRLISYLYNFLGQIIPHVHDLTCKQRFFLLLILVLKIFLVFSLVSFTSLILNIFIKQVESYIIDIHFFESLVCIPPLSLLVYDSKLSLLNLSL